MKKNALIVLVMLVAEATLAQEITTDYQHSNGMYYNMHNIVEAEDNTMIVQCPLFEAFPYGCDIGSIFYKVSMEGMLLDSLLVPADTVPYRTLFEPVNVDFKKNYLYGWFEKNLNDSTTYLKMVFLDEELHIVDTKDVPIVNMLDERIIKTSDMFIDPNQDIIATYLLEGCIHVYRIGLDGEVKASNSLPRIETFSSLELQARHSGVYCKTPLTYYFIVTSDYSNYRKYINAYLIDSNLQDAGHHRYDRFSRNRYWHNDGMQEDMVDKDDSTYLLFSRAVDNYGHHFTALVEYDRNHDDTGCCLFEEGGYYSISPIRAAVAAPDTIYYAYMTESGSPNQLALACLDRNLNVRWVRYFLDTGEFYWGTTMTLLSGGRVAVGAYLYGYTPNRIAVVVIKDGSWNVGEKEDIIRPYTFYPNPAKDQLYTQFSPDVQPVRVELYDLQGRLVRAQRSAFETIDLSQLPAGTYTMRVIMKDGKTYSDKVVKE